MDDRRKQKLYADMDRWAKITGNSLGDSDMQLMYEELLKRPYTEAIDRAIEVVNASALTAPQKLALSGSLVVEKENSVLIGVKTGSNEGR